MSIEASVIKNRIVLTMQLPERAKDHKFEHKDSLMRENCGM